MTLDPARRFPKPAPSTGRASYRAIAFQGWSRVLRPYTDNCRRRRQLGQGVDVVDVVVELVVLVVGEPVEGVEQSSGDKVVVVVVVVGVGGGDPGFGVLGGCSASTVGGGGQDPVPAPVTALSLRRTAHDPLGQVRRRPETAAEVSEPAAKTLLEVTHRRPPARAVAASRARIAISPFPGARRAGWRSRPRSCPGRSEGRSPS